MCVKSCWKRREWLPVLVRPSSVPLLHRFIRLTLPPCPFREYRSRFASEETVSFCLRVMVGVIILYDYVHPVGAFAKSSKIDVSKAMCNGGIRIQIFYWSDTNLTWKYSTASQSPAFKTPSTVHVFTFSQQNLLKVWKVKLIQFPVNVYLLWCFGYISLLH